MGVISIRSSSAQLGNLGATPVRQVHMPSYQVNKRTGKPDAIASQQHIARGMQDLGRAMLNITLSLKRDQTNIALNEAEAEYEKAVRERMMDPQGGFLTMNLNNSGAIESFAKDSTKMLDDMREEIAKKHELSGGTREVFNNRTQGVYSGWSRQIARRTLRAHDILKRNAAANLTEQKYQDWLMDPLDSNTTKELVDCFRAQCYTNGDDDQAAAANVNKYCRGLAFDYATHTFRSIKDEKGINATLEKLEKDPSGLIVLNEPLAEYFGSKSPFDRKGIEGLKSLLGERQREIIRNDCNAANLMLADGYSAASEIRDQDGNYPKDRVARIEKSIRAADDFAKTQPPGSKARTIAERGRVELDEAADKIATSEWQERLINGDCVTRDEKTGVVTVSKPIGMIKGSREDRAFDAAKEKYMKAVEDAGNDLEKARAKIWDGNKEILQRKLVSYYQAAAEPGEVGTRRAQEAYHELMSAWSEMSGGSLSPDFTLGFQKTVKEIDQKEIADGMRLFWSMLKGVEVLGPKDYNSRQASSSAPKFDKYGGLTDATVRRMDLGAEVAYDTGNPAEPFVMTVDEALQFSERVRNELANLDPKELQKSGVVRDVISRVYSNAAKKIVEKDIGKVQALSQTFGETIEELQTKMREPAARSLVEAVEDEKKTDEIRKRYEQK